MNGKGVDTGSKRTNVAVLIGFFLLLVNDLIGATSEPEQGPKLLARFDESSSSLRTLFLYSDRELDAVYVWLGGKWTAATSKGSKQTDERPPHYVYRVSARFVPTDGRSLLVNSWSPTRENTFRHELQIAQADVDYRVTAQLVNTRTRDEYLATKRHRVLRPSSIEAGQAELSGDPYGFIPLLNQYRASCGLNPVAYDPALLQDAHTNNTMNSPHGFMGRARVQNWGAGYNSASAILRGWQNSPGHNRTLLNPSISRVGIAFSQGEWTFNGR